VRELFGLSDDEPDARAQASAGASSEEVPDNVRPFSRRTRAGGSGSS
jgi:hypothetical protein